MRRTTLFVALTAGLVGGGRAAADEPKPAEMPPYERLLQGDDAKQAAALDQRIRELREKDRYAEAIQTAAELLALRRRVQGADHYEAVSVKWYVETLRKVAALPAGRRAAWRQAEQGDQEARRLERKGQFAQALPLEQRLLELRRQVLGEAHPDTATSYNNVAYFLDAQGRYAEAEPLFRRALDIYQQALGEQHPDTAQSYNNVAHNLDTQGKYAGAEPLYRQALAIKQQTLGEQHPDTALGYNNVAANLEAQGKYVEAEPLNRRALAIYRKALGEQHPRTALSYNGLAYNLDGQGKAVEAEPLYRQALAIRRKALGDEHPETAESYNNVAYNLNAQGKYAEAEPLYRRALDIRQQALGEQHPLTASSYNNVAGNLDDQGKAAEAEPLYRQALAIYQQALGEQHPDTARNYYNLAYNLHAQGQHAPALAVLQAGTRAYEAARLRLSSRGLGRAAFGAKQSPWPLLAAALARAGRPAKAWQALESDLARGLLDEARDRTGAAAPADERRQQQALLSQFDQLQPRILQLVSRKEPTAVERQQLQALLDERARAEQQLARLAAQQSQREVAARERLQAQLPAAAALVAWVDVTDQSGGVQEYWGCVLRATGEPAWVRLPGTGKDGAWTKDDTALPGRVRQALANRESPADEVAALCRRLGAQRLEPFAPHLDGVRRLFVVPVGVMVGLPLEALTDRCTVSYLPSGTQLVRLAEAPPRATAGTLLALGDPVFVPPSQQHPDEPPALAASRGPGHTELPGTAREVRALAALFERPTLLLRSEASEQQLEALRVSGQLGEYRYLHFATHGQANRAKAFESALILAQDALPDATKMKARERFYDGRLTASEVLESWKLNAELVTLSACESGLGRYGGGEGLLGFSQAFLLAGARAVVLSLWKVDDQATALLMQRFYQNLLGKRDGLAKPLPKAEALREAKGWLRGLTAEQIDQEVARLPKAERGGVRPRASGAAAEARPYVHPYYWSAFILIGDPD
jgi:CHAT domain-containing protein/Tfp pilus assembly protein PilF